MGSPCDQLPPSLRDGLPAGASAIKEAYKTVLKEQHTALFKASPRYSKLAEVDTSMPSAKYKKLTKELSRRSTSVLTQLRTGHAPLNFRLHRIGMWETPFCAHCKTQRETVFHYAMGCSAYREHRDAIRNLIPQEMFTFSNLLSHPECVPGLLEYVYRTNRLRLLQT